MIDSIALNLTRKWRSKGFDQVVGQELSIRILKNSLYRNQFFPVYLFSGQRGCGKTSTARIFAAAVNCAALPLFQANPKSTPMPCLTCSSCLAFNAGRHPDFFEIDAASHTGIDMVRQLIDSCQLLPIMGNKKIYLIDEAHMLSKASFNALLKILEEPPHSVLFILATTDVHKVIDTVRSRCFQLFFTAISQDHMNHHLKAICTQEAIAFDESALSAIAEHADGSLRDALNLLEQVRFSSGRVTKQAVLTVLGYLDDEQVVTLLEKLCWTEPASLLAYMQEIRLESYSPERTWERLVAAVRTALWVKHGARPQDYGNYESRIKRIVAHGSWSVISQLGDRLHTEHMFFQKTAAKYAVLEMILLQVCSNNGSSTTGTAGAAAQVAPGSVVIQETAAHEFDSDEQEVEDEQDQEVKEGDIPALWSRFVAESGRLADPLLKSILQQGSCSGYKNHEVIVQFSKQFVFFQEELASANQAWRPLLQGIFGPKATLKITFTAEPEMHKKSETKRAITSHNKKMSGLDIASNPQKWPLAHIVMQQFPGTITEIGETTHG